MTEEERRRTPNARDIFAQLGVDIDDPQSLREYAEDQFWIRRRRKKEESRSNSVWIAVMTAIVGALSGALTYLITNFLHTGKPTP